uniref:Uncharacterized protein n=1 Tax=viral metagenome TaxID=1070528 RepID=A0A6M3JUU3_9ZZZZ
MPIFSTLAAIGTLATLGTVAGAGAVAAGAAAVAGTGYAMSKSMSDAAGKGMSMPAMPEAPKLEDSGATVTQAAEQAKEIAKQRKQAIGRNKTVFTSPMGITEEATTAKKTLLGR